MKKIIFLYFLCLSCAFSQTKSILFLGNSYTYYNNLPTMVQDMATSTGLQLIVDSSTPGGYTLQQHASNATSLTKIQQGNWDFVVLQEQSQLPSFPISTVNALVFPYATQLNNKILEHNPCAETVFYMTWGRKNGDSQNCASNPPVCTYQGMDDLLKARYTTMANNNQGILSPVGAVWRHIRTNYPNLELYDSDGSHPSLLGSYAAACTFYTVIFRADPSLITYNSSLDSNTAGTIKSVVENVVYDQLVNWNVGLYDTNALFSHQNMGDNIYSFQNLSTFATSYEWDFGDNTFSTETNPQHQYSNGGEFTVKLKATQCGMIDEHSVLINTTLDNTSFAKENTIYTHIDNNMLVIKAINLIQSIALYDIQGRLIENYAVVEEKNITKPFYQTKGIYIAQFKMSDGQKITKKIIN